MPREQTFKNLFSFFGGNWQVEQKNCAKLGEKVAKKFWKSRCKTWVFHDFSTLLNEKIYFYTKFYGFSAVVFHQKATPVRTLEFSTFPHSLLLQLH